jgi:riboflavin kinase/FMN adenylyltransferase
MKIFRTLSEVYPPDAQYAGTAVTIGKFDGLHTGHRAILAELSKIATARNLRTIAITFEQNPLSLLRPEACPPALSSPQQRLEWLEQEGVNAVAMIPFDAEFASLSPEQFVSDILVDALRAGYVIVGSDYRFGAGGAGNVDTLRALGVKYGFEVDVIEDVLGDAGTRVSSTMVREALVEGDVTHATELLGRFPRVTGIVVRGDARGREIGFPTANIGGEIEGFVPADGVYAGWLVRDDMTYPSAISIGTNPTFEGVRERRVEAYVMDHTLDLYGARVHIDFVKYLRSTLKFESVDELIAQMNVDVADARDVLGLD